MATEYGGYMGKILRIDLTTETVEDYPFTDRQRQETLGGKTLAYRILADHLTGKEQAFSEENLLILSTGPLTGTGAPGSARFEITALSPKSGLPVSSNCGGNFGIFLKKAGYDALILRGRCKTHRWLEINETGSRFHDASDLWGTRTEDCFRQLQEQLSGIPFGCLCVGPAGEDLLPSATVISDGHAAGRAGFGAILGWKNMKAITVSGSKTIPNCNPTKAAKEIKEWNHHILQNPFTSDPAKISSCPGCPIRCKGKEKALNPILNDLGLDSMDAAQYSGWLQGKLGYVPEISINPKHGKRRDKWYQTILEALVLPDCESSFLFYQNLAEAISSLGLCIFAVSACIPEKLLNHPNSLFLKTMCKILSSENHTMLRFSIYPTRLVRYTTGLSIHLGTLLAVGKQSHKLQNHLCFCFQNTNETIKRETS